MSTEDRQKQTTVNVQEKDLGYCRQTGWSI